MVRERGCVFRSAPYHQHGDPLERVLGYLDFRKAILRGGLAEFTCLVGTMVQEVYDSNPEIRAACEASISGHASEVAVDIAAAMKRYRVRADWTAESLALHTQAVLQGAFVLAKARGSADIAPIASITCAVTSRCCSNPGRVSARTTPGWPTLAWECFDQRPPFVVGDVPGGEVAEQAVADRHEIAADRPVVLAPARRPSRRPRAEPARVVFLGGRSQTGSSVATSLAGTNRSGTFRDRPSIAFWAIRSISGDPAACKRGLATERFAAARRRHHRGSRSHTW